MQKEEEKQCCESYKGWPEFYLDPASPSGLRWHYRPKPSKSGRAVERKEGDVAGHIDTKGYWVVFVRSRSFKVHRIVLEMQLGRPLAKDELVDHINWDTADNQLSNLRIVTKAVNSRNVKLRPQNSSGVTGVTYRRFDWPTKVHEVWCAYYTIPGGKQVRKQFSIDVLGRDEAFRRAVEWRTDAIKRLQEQGAGYTDHHGVEKIT